jgi:S-DNA-T family DNA segregation ATPase FtsK/SpoIIIE
MSPREDRHRQEALGVGLFALGLLLALAIVPPALSAAPGGPNLVGPAGAALYRWLSYAFGPVAFLVAAVPVVWGLQCFEVFDGVEAGRWSAFLGALILLVPAGVWLLRGEASATAGDSIGAVGRTLGILLSGWFGVVGGSLILAGVLLSVSVLTLGWSPLRGLGRLSRSAGGLARSAGGAVRAASDALGRRREEAGSAAPEASPWESVRARAEGASEPAAVEPVVTGRAAAGSEQLELEPELADYGDPTRTELPPLDLLREPGRESRGLSERELRALGQILVDKLGTFRVEGEIRGWTTGPVVTQFEVVPAAGIKVGQIAALSDDLALALKAPSVRIVAPIPGKGAVGVEVPNPEPAVVRLREVLESPAYQRSRAVLPLALGRDLAGDAYCADLARMPHLLIAGATGSGKSVCMNTIITSLVYRYPPQQLRLLMIDPKMVELSVYDDLPHLRHPVVTDNQEAASILRWAVLEMNRRYELLSANGCRSLREFNRRVRDESDLRRPGSSERPYEEGELPYIVLLIDELADLMMTVQAEVESPLALLAQKARAVGIHLVIATQRPSVNVITGLIKANFPSRIAFRVASKTDSRTILDQNGAESLLGNGDMLFLPPGEADPVRIQGAFLDGAETEKLVHWYRSRSATEGPPSEEQDILDVVREHDELEARVDVVEEVLEDRDELFRQAAEIVINNDSGSTSLLQRRLRIGYGRAARIIDQLHHAGVVGPSQGSQPREVLVTLDQLDALMEGGSDGTA